MFHAFHNLKCHLWWNHKNGLLKYKVISNCTVLLYIQLADAFLVSFYVANHTWVLLKVFCFKTKKWFEIVWRRCKDRFCWTFYLCHVWIMLIILLFSGYNDDVHYWPFYERMLIFYSLFSVNKDIMLNNS